MIKTRTKRRFKKRLKSFKNLFLRYWAVLIFVACICVGGWYASTMEDETPEQADFGDAQTSSLSQSIAKASFEDALALHAEGKVEEARKVMQRLAPLSEGNEQPRGNGEAHLWMANHLLGAYHVNYLGVFPIDFHEGAPSKSQSIKRGKAVVRKIISHLEHVISISPELDDAHRILASLLVSEGKRNMAVSTLIHGLGHEKDNHGRTLIFIANALTYDGDDLALKEQSWHAFSTLGRDITMSSKGGLSKRIMYAASALVLEKNDVVRTVIARIERDYKDSVISGQASRSVAALRMAIHYFNAVRLQDAAHSGSDYSALVAELMKAYQLIPGEELIVKALMMVVKKQPTLKPAVKKCLEQVDATEQAHDHAAVARKLLLLRYSNNDVEKGRYMQSMLESLPNDLEVVLAVVRERLKVAKPDHAALLQVLANADRGDRTQTSWGLHQGEYHMLEGELELALRNDIEGIAALEKALALVKDAESKRAVHRLLAEAYRKSLRVKLAEMHVAKAGE